jgi:vacuolar-type H+-ATPase subunit E/Vma4
MLRDSDILCAAQQRADEVLAAASNEAQRMRNDADRYAMEVLDVLETELSRQIATVKKGKAALEQIRQEDERHNADGFGARSAHQNRAEDNGVHAP